MSSMNQSNGQTNNQSMIQSFDQTIKIPHDQVIQLIEQYLHEQGLTETLDCLKRETNVSFNGLSNPNVLWEAIRQGKWDQVMSIIQPMNLSLDQSVNLYEQMLIELIEAREIAAARVIMDQSEVIASMKSTNQIIDQSNNQSIQSTNYRSRYQMLEHLIEKPVFDAALAYQSINQSNKQSINQLKLARREAIVQSIKQSVFATQPSRLLSLINQSIQWQQFQGINQSVNQSINFFQSAEELAKLSNNQSKDNSKINQSVPTKITRQIKLLSQSTGQSISCVIRSSNNGKYFASGTSDGFIEIYDWSINQSNNQSNNQSFSKDFKFQVNDEFLCHSQAINQLEFDLVDRLIVSSSIDQSIKVWLIDQSPDQAVNQGKCLFHFRKVYEQSINQLSINQSTNQLMSCDRSTILIHSLATGLNLQRISIGQSIKQSIKQSIDQSVNQSDESSSIVSAIWSKQSNNQSPDQSINCLMSNGLLLHLALTGQVISYVRLPTINQSSIQLSNQSNNQSNNQLEYISMIDWFDQDQHHLLVLNDQSILIIQSDNQTIKRTLSVDPSMNQTINQSIQFTHFALNALGNQIYVTSSSNQSNSQSISPTNNLFVFDLMTGRCTAIMKVNQSVNQSTNQVTAFCVHPHLPPKMATAFNDGWIKILEA